MKVLSRARYYSRGRGVRSAPEGTRSRCRPHSACAEDMSQSVPLTHGASQRLDGKDKPQPQTRRLRSSRTRSRRTRIEGDVTKEKRRKREERYQGQVLTQSYEQRSWAMHSYIKPKARVSKLSKWNKSRNARSRSATGRRAN